MPLPFDLLAIMLFIGWYAETPVNNPPSLAYGFAAFGIAVAVMSLIAAAVGRYASAALCRPGRSPSQRRNIAGQAELIIKLSLVGIHVALLYESALPWSLIQALQLGPDAAGGYQFWLQLFGLAPFLVLFVAAWLPTFKLHRLISYGSWTRRSYLLHKAQYNLYMLLVWLPFAWLEDRLMLFAPALPLLFVAVAWAFPAVIAWFWRCKPLPQGEILDAVKRMEALAGAKFSRVFLWEPGGNVMTAAALGLAPPFRYLFLTRALVDGLQPDELEAVILHELGHVKKRHLLFYMFVSLAGINAAVLAGALAPLANSGERFLCTAALVLLYFRFIFGWLSRNMERQADLFAMEKSGSARGIANALEKLGLAAGNVRLAHSWHHYGIAQRVDFLRRAERRPELARYHDAGVGRIMLAGYLSAVLVVGGMSWLLFEELSIEARPVTMQGAASADAAHWRRVRRLLPGDAGANLELAYRLAGQAGGRAEAEALAAEAKRLAADTGDRGMGEAAEKLLRELRDQ